MIKTRATFGMPNTLPALNHAVVLARLWLAFCGVLLVAISFFQTALPGKLGPALFIGCWLALPARDLLQRRKAKPRSEPDPRLRVYLMAIFVFSACIVLWGRKLGLSWPVVLSLLLLVEALSSFIVSLTEWWRLSTIGLSIALMVCGLGLPFVSEPGILFGAAIFTGSVISAAILSWQILRASKEPNQSLEPTATAVTDRAAHAPRQP